MTRKNNAWHPVHPYVFYMSIIFSGVMCLALIFCIGWVLPEVSEATIRDFISNPYACACIILMIPILILTTYYAIRPYESFGIVKVVSDGLVIKAPFRRLQKIKFSEMQYVELIYSGQTGIWIWFGPDYLSDTHRNDIKQLPITKSSFRVAYSERLYNELMSCAPYRTVGKKLSRCSSIIHMYNSSKGNRS